MPAAKKSSYDLIAVDLPWIGEFAASGMIHRLDRVMDVSRLDPADFHTAGWRATHWNGAPYGVPSQTTPELMFYRRDWFADEGLEPPVTTGAVYCRRAPISTTRATGATGWPGTRHAARRWAIRS